MRILVYGFGPYRQFRDNISARLIERLPIEAGLKTIVFPVRFQRRQFVAAIRRHQPDVVLGLGQSSRKRIEVEKRARNRRRERQFDKPRPIFANRPLRMPTTLKLRSGRWVGTSRNAGDYVCNYSMYVLLDEIARGRRAVRFGFIHIPHDYDLDKAGRMLRRVLKQCRRPG
jgi:pyroglutamyl-peptidase